MNIHMSDKIYSNLRALCGDDCEQAGNISIILEGDSAYITGFEPYSKEIYLERGPDIIDFNTDLYYIYIFKRIAQSNIPVFVEYHTHPGPSSTSDLSDGDEDHLKFFQECSNKLKKPKLGGKPSIIIEAVITLNCIGFYYMDGGVIKRAPLFVDGEEVIPYKSKDLSKKEPTIPKK